MTPMPTPIIPSQLSFLDVIPIIISALNFIFVVSIFLINWHINKSVRLATSKVDWFKNTIINKMNYVDIFFNGIINIHKTTIKNENYIDNISNQYSQLLNDFNDNFCIYIDVMYNEPNDEIINFLCDLEDEFISFSEVFFARETSDVAECINRYHRVFLNSLYSFMINPKSKFAI